MLDKLKPNPSVTPDIIDNLNNINGYIRGYGIDIVDVKGFAEVLNLAHSKCLDQYFTLLELKKISNHDANRLERLAGRFALKEAVMKALGVGWGNGVTFTDVEVLNKSSGEPFIQLKGKLVEIEKSKKITSWFVTVSHISIIAIASAIAIGGADK